MINISTTDSLLVNCFMYHSKGMAILFLGLKETLVYSFPFFLYISTNGKSGFMPELTIFSELEIRLAKDIKNNSAVESAILFTVILVVAVVVVVSLGFLLFYKLDLDLSW